MYRPVHTRVTIKNKKKNSGWKDPTIQTKTPTRGFGQIEPDLNLLRYYQIDQSGSFVYTLLRKEAVSETMHRLRRGSECYTLQALQTGPGIHLIKR